MMRVCYTIHSTMSKASEYAMMQTIEIQLVAMREAYLQLYGEDHQAYQEFLSLVTDKMQSKLREALDKKS